MCIHVLGLGIATACRLHHNDKAPHCVEEILKEKLRARKKLKNDENFMSGDDLQYYDYHTLLREMDNAPNEGCNKTRLIRDE